MLKKRTAYISLILLILSFLILGVSIEKYSARLHSEEKISALFQGFVNEQFNDLDKLQDDFAGKIKDNDYAYDIMSDNAFCSKADKSGYDFFLFRNDSLLLWTDNSIQTHKLLSRLETENGIIFLGNGWYLYQNRQIDEGVSLSGLILIKHEYAYENDFLHNEYNNKLNIPSCVGISTIPVEGGQEILGASNEFLCSLYFPPGCKSESFPFSSLFYAMALLSFLFLLRTIIKSYRHKNTVNLMIAGSVIILAVLDFSIFYFKWPSVFFQLELFSPFHFAVSPSCSSLGDLLIHSLFVFFVFYNFFRDFRLKDIPGKDSALFRGLISLAGFIFAAVFFSLIVFIFNRLLMDSSILFEPYKILKITYLSFAGFLSIVLLFISFGLYLYKLINIFKPRLSRNLIFSHWMLSVILFVLFEYFFLREFEVFSIALYLLLGFVIYRLSPGFSYAALVFFAVLFGIYSTIIIVINSELKEEQNRKLIAVNLSVDRDPVAELMFDKIAREINYDEGLRSTMSHDEFSDDDVARIFDHLRNNIFTAYMDNYDLYITLCNASSNLIIDDSTESSCFRFFKDLVNDKGTPLSTEGFFHLNLGISNISYFGSFFFDRQNDSLLNGLFMELYSRPVLRQLGYPELLLDKSQARPSARDEYSYAKYNEGKLLMQSGDYKYNLSADFVYTEGQDFIKYKADGFKHLAYFASPGHVVVVSQKEIKLSNLLISFSYIFVFLFIVSNLLFLLASLSLKEQRKTSLLKYKIQLWMISILFFSLVLIGLATIFFSISQYRENQFKILSEKIQSVYVEIDHKLGFEEAISSSWSSDNYQNLDELLMKFSNVFFTDINLYDPDGNIMATSRPEIFEKGLSGEKMDYKAYCEMVINRKAEYVHEESIGRLKFLSAYVPFVNQDNQLLAYLNLPYFTRENSLRSEISNLVVAIINFSMVMILVSLILAVLISNQITTPLRVIRQKIAKIKLGNINEPIVYTARDEIGSLVDEYNRMIGELAKNVEALARSERESAWREMARQIAHEIKNPLTPMKLSIQQLQRSWKDNAPNWDKQLKKVSVSLIEQIDNLSSIASAFSDFAALPRAKNKAVDLVAQVNKLVTLFSNEERTKISVDFGKHAVAYVYADENQLGRVITNLIKNAIQSVPSGRDPEIGIVLEISSSKVILKIIDNGEGIPGELEEKLFEPNFTTKSSGMGLGLAIARKIINDAGGLIYYETEIGRGTKFIIELPEYLIPT